ncbi:MAG: histidine kinase [Gaiellales bacterium]
MPSRSRSASPSSTEPGRGPFGALRTLGLALAAAAPILLLERRRHRLAEEQSRRRALLREARLRQESDERDTERGRLSARLITAEQDERRRLSVALHDGPLGSLAGIVLMQDAALASLRAGEAEEATRLLEGSIQRARETVQALRDLSFAMEPVVLRDQSFEAAVSALGDQLARDGRIAVGLEVGDGDLLEPKAQAALYQTIREALDQALRRRPARIDVAVTRLVDGSYRVLVADDGVEERRRDSTEAIEERARLLGGRVRIDTSDDGTEMSIVIPAYVAAVR